MKRDDQTRDSHAGTSSRLFWIGIGAAWVAWGLVNATTVRFEAGLDWKTALWFGLPDAAVWFALTPLVLWLARRFPIAREGWLRSLALHVAAAPAIATLHAAVDAVLNSVLHAGGLDSFGALFAHLMRYTTHQNVLTYFVVSGFAHYAAYSRRVLEQEKHAVELTHQLAQARLGELRAQLRPHFLFNSLHTISSLMERDPVAGQRVVARLGQLLRASLDDTERGQISLADELELVRAYLEVEQARFRDRLRHRIDADGDALGCAVPALLLQPLVENAVHHGISRKAEGGCIEIEARRVGDALSIRIRDDGAGLNGSLSRGVGLSNTGERLEVLYPDAHTFVVVPGRDAGVEVQLELPARRLV